MYDYYLCGCHNFAVDRAAAERVLEIFPDTGVAARTNRAFLRRAVRYAAEQGVRQFLDIGAGLPAQGNVHEIVRSVAPDSPVVYVDHDEAVAYTRRLLPTDGWTDGVDDRLNCCIGHGAGTTTAPIWFGQLRSSQDVDGKSLACSGIQRRDSRRDTSPE